MSRRLGLILIAGLVWAGAARAQVITGDVASVGFSASKTSGTGFVARRGQWVPIQVRLMVQGSQLFQGQLRLESADLDGDLVSYVETPVTVTADAGLKRAWCYAICLDPFAGGRPATINVVNDDGDPVARLPLPLFDPLSNDTMLILDISAQPLTKLSWLETSNWLPGSTGYGVHPYYRNVLIAKMQADELPDRWIGLEAVDVVVWDRPDPVAVSIAQMQALIQWVHNGGRLVVGLGQSWTAVQQSKLAEIIPLQPRTGESPGAGSHRPPTMDVITLPEFFARLIHPSIQDHDFRSPVTVALAEAKPGALRALQEYLPAGPRIDLVATQWVGSGRVTAVAASLSDLMRKATLKPDEPFCTRLFDLNPTTDKLRDAELNSWQLGLGEGTARLYEDVVEPIGFRSGASMLVLAAFAFVVAYIGLATLASWRWLKRHTLTPLSWTVFAVSAMVASVVSLGAVSVLHGVSRGVHTVSFVDLEAGRRPARARCYFGYSSPIRRRVDLTLPGEGTFLRALARGPVATGPYATPLRYSAVSGKALLQDTPMRATLKQFEGFWQGELEGTVRAQLVASRRTGEITPGSWIQNDLGVDLAGGFLLYVDPRIRNRELADRPTPAGNTNRYWAWFDPDGAGRDVPPGMNVLAMWISPVPAGQKLSGIGQESYQRIGEQWKQWDRRGERKLGKMPDLPTLWGAQAYWVGVKRLPFGSAERSLEPAAQAALLASTRTFYLHCKDDAKKLNNTPITTDGLMNCDVSHWLACGRVKAPAGQTGDSLRGQAVLLLWSNDPGPAELRGNNKALKADRGHSLYRVRVPIRFEGNPPTGI